MTRQWLRIPTAALALTSLLAALTAGCGSKSDAPAPGAAPTAEQAQASQKIGQQAAAGQAALHSQQGQQPK